jgi:hypothetical protein
MQTVLRNAPVLARSVRWVDSHTNNRPIVSNGDTRLHIACLDMAIELQAAIYSLHEAGLLGSMFALVRVQFESVVRGLWLAHCASEKEISEFEDDKVPKIKDMIAGIELAIPTAVGLLSSFKELRWNEMCGFTHTGIIQASGRLSGYKVGSSYDQEDVNRYLGYAATFGMMAAGEIVAMINDPQLIAEFQNEMASNFPDD